LTAIPHRQKRKLVNRLSERAFVLAVEALLVLTGLKLLLFPG